ncbi:hypothetical protein SPSF3K_00236 [Streptococcus parauberis]|uniref:DUF4811 domain-containing protein n=1 Tax=Streptococcus parauberis KRS-02083 TaxID=1207545 RepID=A0ABP2SX94_9STRE|nr:DUF4811 domain-containing protein [Streptococcus parauberis]AUT04977.1 hypothetical protein SPSF3K_00236 [Streptococcus parauberis]EMG25068.1 hypothetical protein SPJ1_1516 [Streptococcus parauberis KRS-02083]UWV10438.1 DUF4811 domain-containing protein [Streptococcus parauberis]WEM61306.1 DUF4811 domain-containing protein [Streptococcus parauberis]WEM64941.1 DUF4811 domain-containing protein [Streptococcus parauberis]
MILFLIIISTILSFITWMYIQKTGLRYLLGSLSLLLLLASTFILTDHFVNHTGMKTETKVTEKAIYTAGDTKAAFGLLLNQKIGSKSDHHVLIYRDQKEQEKAKAHFIPNKKKISQAIKKTANYKMADTDKAIVITTTKRYVWASDFAKMMYGFGDENHELISEKAQVIVPKDTWLVLTPKQAKKLANLVPQLKAQQEKAMKANPKMAMQMQALAKKDPKAFTKMQVEQLEKALGITE